ncbi:hypothetical protein RJ640_016535 [Escallonia rubra]|uniref:Alpha/beta hydrolase fold-3 domain-containing protein n=1 Tax=Escallonia rubra TaxID=112253 RepID=A0AA88UN14_9ASTE|nr:hypothetical protein RJ640_016535 [Escallonia rubra]
MASTKTEVAHDFHPWFRVYKDGHVERFLGRPSVPPSDDRQTAAVRSKDVTVSNTASARLFLPKATAPHEKLPFVIYIHGGAFSIESAFSSLYHNYLNSSSTNAASSRLAPEHPLPACYDDCYAVMKWVAQHNGGRPGSETGPDPWLNDHADFGKVYLAGDSAGANLAHNMVVRADGDRLMKISGLVLIHPFFGNEEPTKLWEFICSDSGGVNDPRLNPGAHPGLLSKLGCEKVLILTASKDFIRERGRSYCEALRGSGWRGAVETEGEEHVFHLFKPTSEKAKAMMRCLVSFINPTSAPSA